MDVWCWGRVDQYGAEPSSFMPVTHISFAFFGEGFALGVCRSAGFVPSVQWGLNFQTPGNATILSSGGIHACVLDTNKKARPIRGAVVKKSSSYFQLRRGVARSSQLLHQRLDFGLCAYCNFTPSLSLSCLVVRKFFSMEHMELSRRPSQTNSPRLCWSGWSHDFSLVSVALSELWDLHFDVRGGLLQAHSEQPWHCCVCCYCCCYHYHCTYHYYD